MFDYRVANWYLRYRVMWYQHGHLDLCIEKTIDLIFYFIHLLTTFIDLISIIWTEFRD